MVDMSSIKEHMEVIGADGVHVGTVDKLEGDRLKLTKRDGAHFEGQGGREGHHRYLSVGLVAGVEGDKVRLSTTAANAFMFQDERDGSARLVADTPASRPAPPVRSSAPAAAKRGSDVDWTTVGLGTAALGLLSGAALLARRYTRRDRSELQLHTDENVRLISSSKVEGTAVVGRDGERLGAIRNFMVDKYTGRVAYAVMSFGGTLGFGEALFPLPWSYLTYDTARDGYVLGVTKEQLATAPRFSASDAPEFDAGYRRDLGRHYGRGAA